MRAFVGVALLLLAASLGLYLGVARPESRAAAALEARLANLRREHAGLSERLDRHASNEERLGSLLRSRAAEVTSLATTRRKVLAALSNADLEGVRFDVAAARPPAAAAVKVEAAGRFLDLVALSTRLSGPELDLVLERVTFERAQGTTEIGGGSEIAIEGSVLGRAR